MHWRLPCLRSSLLGNQCDDFLCMSEPGQRESFFVTEITNMSMSEPHCSRKVTFPMGAYGALTLKQTTLLACIKVSFSKELWIHRYTRSTPRLWGTLPNLCSLYRPLSAKLFMEALARNGAAWVGYMGRIGETCLTSFSKLLGKKPLSSPPPALMSLLSLLHAPCPQANKGCVPRHGLLEGFDIGHWSHNFPTVKFREYHELLSNI